MRIRALGIDPGFRNTGLAVVELDGQVLRCIAVKYVGTPPAAKRKAHLLRTNADDLDRMRVLHEAVAQAIERGQVHCVGIETYKIAGGRGKGNARGGPKSKFAQAGGNAWKTIIAYGVSTAAAYQANLRVYAHDPFELKAGVVGYVQASKQAVEDAILAVLPGAAEAVERADIKDKDREHVFDAMGHALLALRAHRDLAVEVPAS